MENTLFFPGLGLEFEVDRVAFSLLGRPIYWYGIIIAIGFLLAVLFCSRQAPKFGLTSDQLTDVLLFGVPLSIIGTRVYYVVFYLDLYRREDGSLDIPAMLRISDGGLAIYGGVITAFLVLFLFCKVKKLSFFAFADLVVCGLLIGQSVGRWGNFMNVEAYGGVTALPWRMCGKKIAGELYGKGLVDAQGYYEVIEGTIGVHPTFFYESLWNLAGFLILVLVLKTGRRAFDGENLCFYLIWYGAGRFWIEGLRTDSLYLFGTGLRVSQLVAVVSLAVGIVVSMLGRRSVGKIPLYVDKIKGEKEIINHGDHS